jgi:hypothetical protein
LRVIAGSFLACFALRTQAKHEPRSEEALSEIYRKNDSPDAEKRLTGLLGAERKGKQVLGRSLSVQLIQPLLSALTLEALFDPDVLTEHTRDKVTGRLFDAIVEASDHTESADVSRREGQRGLQKER